MTFFIDLSYSIYGEGLNETNNVDWWANQVPEKGDFITVYSKEFERKVDIKVTARIWNMTRQTGGSGGGHDVIVEAYGEIT